MKAMLIGVGILSGFFAPFAIFGLLGWWLWGDSGILLAVAPYLAGFFLFVAWHTGEEFKHWSKAP